MKGTVNAASYKYIALNDSAFVRKASSINIWVEKLWRNSSGLHRALTSTLLNTFGMTWKRSYKSGLLVQHQFLRNVLSAEWPQIATDIFQYFVK